MATLNSFTGTSLYEKSMVLETLLITLELTKEMNRFSEGWFSKPSMIWVFGSYYFCLVACWLGLGKHLIQINTFS